MLNEKFAGCVHQQKKVCQSLTTKPAITVKVWNECTKVYSLTGSMFL